MTHPPPMRSCESVYTESRNIQTQMPIRFIMHWNDIPSDVNMTLGEGVSAKTGSGQGGSARKCTLRKILDTSS